jgi:hypothetical protein
MMCKRKILRKINGPRYENGYWGKVKCGYINLIRLLRLEWLGRVVRIEGERTVKELMEGKRGGG